MTGLIRFVQIVHYPLFTKIGSRGFAQYAESHRHLTSLVVVPLMLLELLSAFLLPFYMGAALLSQRENCRLVTGRAVIASKVIALELFGLVESEVFREVAA